MSNTTVPVNTSVDPAAPDIAVDNIGGSLFQRIKVGWGDEGTVHDTTDVEGARFPVGGAHFQAATAVDCGSGTDDEAIAPAATGRRFVGYSCYETTGAAGATVIIHNGTGNVDPAIHVFTLANNESRSEWMERGIASADGIWLERASGDVRFVGLYRDA